MGVRRPAGARTIQQKNAANRAKKKARGLIGRSGPAKRNKAALASAGSPEAKAFNARASKPSSTPSGGSSNVQASFETSPRQFAPQASFENQSRELPSAQASFETQPIPRTGAELAADDFQRAIDRGPLEVGIGGAGLLNIGIKSIGTRLAAIGKTKVAESLSLGSVLTNPTSSAAKIATNSKTVEATTTWLTKLAATAKNPAFVASAFIAMVGSYPFAGFIKEEALQTLGFGVNSAIRNDDFEGAQAAIDFQKEILEPTLWQNIRGGIPFVNVLESLGDFYESAQIKLSIDEQVIADLRIKSESGETDTEYYTRIAEQRVVAQEKQRAADIDYYANIAAQQAAAKAAERIADEKYWANILAQKEKDAADQRRAEEDYWNEYYKTIQKSRDDNSPSRLNFGLI